MASTSRGGSRSISPAARWIYDVFLSFRGEDTRKGFTDHLYISLVQRGIRTFRDDKEVERGKVIAPELSKAIEGSMFSIVVFSRNFAFSTWCLDELVKIIECMKEVGQTVLPVFYDVEPSHVRKQTGNFGAAFAEFEGSKEKMDKVQRWRDALTEAANLSGWNLHHGYEYESKVIKEITEYIFIRLHQGKHLNGEQRCETKNMSIINNVSCGNESFSGTVSLEISLGDIRMSNSYVWKSNHCKQICFTTTYKSGSPKRQIQNEACVDGSRGMKFDTCTGNLCEKPELCVNIEGNFTFSCNSKGDGRGWIVNRLHVVKSSLGSLWLKLIHKRRGLEDTSFQRNSGVTSRLEDTSFQRNSGVTSGLEDTSFQEGIFFQRNSGLLLQLLPKFDFSDKLFTEEELKKATNNYDKHMVIGLGGYGRVYRGILGNNCIVAVKVKNLNVHGPWHEHIEFINEMAILSQVKHRNVVGFLGCCLETKVPVLVYEYVSNGTLSDHIHIHIHCGDSNKPVLSWEIRLKIAADIAGALSYLHYEVCTPIIHLDIKPSNILLDNNYTPRLCDFGISKLIPLGQTQVSTVPSTTQILVPRDEIELHTGRIQGTYGYMAPECMLEGKMTLKSDVYSFGVVLVELLTGMRPFDMGMRLRENMRTQGLEECCFEHVKEVVDQWCCILNEGNVEQVKGVADLAQRCLNPEVKGRPTMREVAMQLEELRTKRCPMSNGNEGPTMREVEMQLNGLVWMITNPGYTVECSLTPTINLFSHLSNMILSGGR